MTPVDLFGYVFLGVLALALGLCIGAMLLLLAYAIIVAALEAITRASKQ